MFHVTVHGSLTCLADSVKYNDITKDIFLVISTTHNCNLAIVQGRSRHPESRRQDVDWDINYAPALTLLTAYLVCIKRLDSVGCLVCSSSTENIKHIVYSAACMPLSFEIHIRCSIPFQCGYTEPINCAYDMAIYLSTTSINKFVTYITDHWISSVWFKRSNVEVIL